MNCRVSRDRKSDQSHLTKNSGILKVLHMAPHQHYCGKREKEKKVILIRENKRTAGKDFFFREMKYLLEKDNRFKVT